MQNLVTQLGFERNQNLQEADFHFSHIAYTF